MVFVAVLAVLTQHHILTGEILLNGKMWGSCLGFTNWGRNIINKWKFLKFHFIDFKLSEFENWKFSIIINE